MHAYIQSRQHPNFNCCVKAEPVCKVGDLSVYELFDSVVPDDITITNGKKAGTCRHVALDSKGLGFVFDFQSKEAVGTAGLCDYRKPHISKATN